MISPQSNLNQFISDNDGFSWRRGAVQGVFELTSGPWRGENWKHEVVIVEPSSRDVRTPAQSTAILYITGGDANPLDIAEAQAIADRSALPVAVLFHIPNQPIFDLWEDDLIAHTFEQYIETGDPTWPLLFPMTRAAIRAIDMLRDVGYERFVVIGASKRGWTTWLAAATGDPRIIGIAPMVIDNLNFPAQMAHQIECWGAYSEQIEDYTSRELQNEMDSVRGAELVVMMDPINYIDRLRCPILIVNGANDRYWTVDALSLYRDLLPATTRCLIVPNVGHILGDKVQMIETVSAFAFACSVGDILPGPRECGIPTGSSIEAPDAEDIRLWGAFSSTLDFRDSEWITVASGSPCSEGLAFSLTDLLTSASRLRGFAAYPPLNAATMVEARYSGPTGRFSSSTPVKVFRNDK